MKVEKKVNASSSFFSNRACEFYPCHEEIEEINCLFCYCPLYSLIECPGRPAFIERDGIEIKDCSGCSFPHKKENYETVMQYIKKEIIKNQQ